MTVLNRVEVSAVVRKLTTPQARLVASKLSGTQQLERLSAGDLTTISSVLAGVNRTHPILYSAKQKIKRARLHVRVPTKDPNAWPKVFRQTKRVSGVEKGKNQQHFRLNPTALPIKLNKLHAWSQTSQTDLIIVGPLASIVTAVNKAPVFAVTNDMVSSNATDQSLQHDQKYGDTIDRTNKESMDVVRAANPVPTFSITCDAKSRITNETGEVVLDPLKDVVDMVGGAVSGFAGGFNAAAPAIVDILKTATDGLDLVAEPATKILQKVRARMAKDKNKAFTITIGIVNKTGHKSSINTGRTELNHDELVAAICAALARGA